MGSGSSLFSPPHEVRYEVYSYLFPQAACLQVNGRVPCTVIRNRDINGLRQVCRLLRVETERYFYLHHSVIFDTRPGLNLWLNQWPDELLWLQNATVTYMASFSFNKDTVRHFVNLQKPQRPETEPRISG